jgi:hypothetical protein
MGTQPDFEIFELCGTWANRFWKKKCITYDVTFLIYDYIFHKLIYTIKNEKIFQK